MIREYKTVPMAGKVITHDGQRYLLVGSMPHKRKSDGALSVILIWSSQCPECDATFETTTGLKIRDLNRRCSAHRTPRKPVKPKTKKKSRRKK